MCGVFFFFLDWEQKGKQTISVSTKICSLLSQIILKLVRIS